MLMPSNLSTTLQYQHKSLVDIIDGLSDEQVRIQLVPGKWTIFETIVHLQTYQHSFIKRVKQILEDSNPLFERYRADADPLFHENCKKSSREIMHDMITIRKSMASEMMSFGTLDLSKKGRHPVYGEMTLSQWLNFFLLHEAHHLFVIFKMAAELKANAKA